MQVEQILRLGNFAMVALFGFFQLGQIRLQVFVVQPGGAVDAAEHLVVVIATPISTSHLHQLERAQLVGGGHVRATTEVGELALRIQRQLLVRRDAFDDLGLVSLADAFEVGHRIVARLHAAAQRQGFLHDLLHFRFNRGQVFRGERALVGEVVIEAVVDHRADGDLRAGKQPLHGLRQQVRGGMAQDVQRLGGFFGHDGQRSIVVDAVAGIHQFVIHFASQGRLGQASADTGGHFGHRHRIVKRAYGTIGKGDIDHGSIPENTNTKKAPKRPLKDQMRRQVQRWAQVVFMSHARPACAGHLSPFRCHALYAWWAVQGSNL